MSDRQIAEYVGVDPMTVGKYRKQLSPSVENLQIETRTVTRGDQEYEIDTANIGRRQAEVKEEGAVVEKSVSLPAGTFSTRASGQVVKGATVPETGF